MSNSRPPSRGVTRRRFLQGMAALAGTAALTAGYGRYAEPTLVQVDQVTLAIPRLPAQLAGRRFAQLSDLHVGSYFSAEQLQQVIQRVNQLEVEGLFLTGDFVTVRDRNRNTRTTSRTSALEALVEPLRAAAIPAYAALGNHDLWGGEEVVIRTLQAAKVQLLRNAALPLSGDLWLAGVDDIWAGRPDLRAALRDVPAGTTTLLMAHEPDYFDTVVMAEAPVSVQLSGHTHGGQVRLPTLLPGPDGLYSFAPIIVEFGKRYPIGLRQLESRFVYTNRGLGCWPVPYRINCPPEITVFTLEQG